MSSDRSYGTNGSNNAGGGIGASTHTTEQDALLPKSNSKQSSLRDHYMSDVRRSRADLVLLFSYITTGLLDSTATAVWGSFVSMQTGNTIYVGLGLADPFGANRWIKSGTSILSFCFGSFLFARFHRRYSVRRRWVLIVSTFLQTLCVTGAAVIVLLTPNGNPTSGSVPWHILVPIALVAFQSSGQAVVSRALNFNALTSVVLTSIYCDLFMDAKLFAGLTENVERNRRIGAPLLLLVGAVGGGFWSQSEIGIVGALWTAVVLKCIVMFIWFIWPSEVEAEN